MTKIFFIFLLFTLFSFSAFCKDYKIAELLEIAEQNSNNIKSAQHLAQAQKRFANQQKYWNNPIVAMNRIGGQDNYSVTQTLPFYNKLQKRYNIEEAEYRALDAQKNNTSLFVKAEVFRLLYRYQALQMQIELAQKRLDRLSLVDKYLAILVLNSPTKKAQWYITKDRIRLVERDMIRFSNELYQTWNEVNIYLNLKEKPTAIEFEWLSDSNYQGKKLLIEAALENNWELKEQKIRIDKSKSELSYVKIEQMPDFNVSAIRGGSNSASSNAGNRDATGVGLSVAMPLLNRNQEKIVAAQANIRAQKASYEFQRNQLEQLIRNDINQYETSLKLAKKFPIRDINQITNRLSEANSDFKRGVLDFITYIELDSQEYQIIDTIINTQVDLAFSYAQLMIKVGNFTLPSPAKENINEVKND